MSYLKKLCVLKQISSGFASDGKKVSGLATFEKFGVRTTICVSLINFAPLSDGRYCAVISDTHGSVEKLELSVSGATKKGTSALDIQDGFACLICHISNRAKPVAFGKCTESVFDVKKICQILEENERGDNLAISESEKSDATKQCIEKNENLLERVEEKSENVPCKCGEDKSDDVPPQYDDEMVATENYFEFKDADIDNLKILEKDDENGKSDENADGESQGEICVKEEKSETCACEDEDAENLFKLENVLHARKPEYYESVKDDILDLFEKFPAEENLQKAVDDSKWVKIEFSPDKYYTVGLIYQLGVPKYICYGVPSENKTEPPTALKGYCSYLPLSLFDLRGKGYWMMYQDADTGRCVHIESE